MKKKIFISYSHKDEELMQQISKHLKVYEFNDSLSVWNDEDIRIGEDFEKKIRKAIDETDIAILLISTDFLVSDFIRNKELEWLEKRYEMNRLEIIPFILKPSNWETYRLSKKLKVRPKDGKPLIEFKTKNGKREKVLSKFAKEINDLYIDLDKNQKVIDVQKNDTDEIFYKAFAIYRILYLSNKKDKYSFKFDSNLYIYKNNLLFETWCFESEITSIDQYSDLIGKNLSNDLNSFVGVVQNQVLKEEFSEFSYFLDIQRNIIEESEDNKIIIVKNLLKSSSLTKSISLISDQLKKINKTLDLEIPNSVYLYSFLMFKGYSKNELRQNIFKLIEEKYDKKLTNDGANIYALEPFLNTFESVLEYIDLNEGRLVDFEDIISRIDLLKLELPNDKSLDFIDKNKELVEENISENININIEKLYVELKAKLHYSNQKNKTQDIDTLNEFIQRDIQHLDFLILLGDFGHGKTTFLKYMTAKLSNEYEEGDYIPVYLSLRHHFTKKGNLRDAVTNALFKNNKFSDEFWNSHKWLVFCDGFDELNVYYQDEPNWVTSVFTELLKESKKANIKIVLSSRPVLFLDPNVKKDTVNKFNRLILKPFDEPQIAKWIVNWSKYNEPITIDDIEERNLFEVSQTPVLLFLIATIFHEELNDENAKYSKSQIYKKFFDWTAKSGGYIQKGENVKHNVPDNYREVLQEVACEIFSHPDAKSGMLHYEVLLKQLSQKFGDKDLKESLNEKIFVAHAFKESLPEHIEFMHQSLREYLVAEKIFNVYYNFCLTSFTNTPVYQFEYDDLVLTKPISQAKLDFFRDLIENTNDENIKKVEKLEYFYLDIGSISEYFLKKDKNTFFDMFNYFEGELIETSQQDIFNSIIGNIIILDFAFKTYVKNYVDINELQKILSFFNSNEEFKSFTNLVHNMFNNFNFDHIKLYNVQFDNFLFSKTEFTGAVFSENSFKDTFFDDCYFGLDKEDLETTFSNCRFDNTLILNSYFSNVVYTDCQYYGSFGEQQFAHNNKSSHTNSEYNNCFFNDLEIDYRFVDTCIFNNCIFKNVKFSDENCESIRDEVEFNNCIMINDNDNWVKVDKGVWD